MRCDSFYSGTQSKNVTFYGNLCVAKAKRQLQMFSVAKAKRQLQLRQGEIDFLLL
ncbi:MULTISPECIES: hypothetical protein [Lysinibacillus]|uniref:hypothetical protein n=1 Tax=Lysinibacillus TaxID=400634 RepID=UPI00163D12FA|nr:hypothetical protein [Lysinibacillus sp. SDF0037]